MFVIDIICGAMYLAFRLYLVGYLCNVCSGYILIDNVTDTAADVAGMYKSPGCKTIAQPIEIDPDRIGKPGPRMHVTRCDSVFLPVFNFDVRK
jgi:hypothetical protein